ncbi:3-hydroxyisobutyrate dehydrogenase [Arcanobacterium wilhelmae]|uniref:3-hydroxyisobutyrate dehydrogenase n=1 Tax=Arcanobacterium wilhelmae TaxID=1803177 RepID=A0ABT9NBH0_9ACTO|nr:NAD(P)-dependent oxidoreductase [Arcanobacterium wilhelmae]MDP9800761.1 3-hydroxyisobutyrate dehydrogenase [Arcanobacterium wilhelmae]
MTTIGFIGLGTMGLPMAKNLLKNGFAVVGYDAWPATAEKAASAGVTMVDSPKAVAEAADDAVISMVRDLAQNQAVLLGDDGVAKATGKPLTAIIMSTLDPDSMDALAADVEAAGDLHVIAAAVSGGSTGAEAGTLSIMSSGPKEHVEAARAYFDAVGTNVFYYGEKPGASQSAKLVNNLVLGIIMNGVAEGLKFGAHYGLPEEELLALFKVSTGDSWVARNWDAVKAWTPDTALAVLLKDLKAAHLKGLEHSIPMPFNALSSTLLFDSWNVQ